MNAPLTPSAKVSGAVESTASWLCGGSHPAQPSCALAACVCCCAGGSYEPCTRCRANQLAPAGSPSEDFCQCEVMNVVVGSDPRSPCAIMRQLAACLTAETVFVLCCVATTGWLWHKRHRQR